MKYLYIVALNPLFTLLVRNMKHTWSSHFTILFSLLPKRKIVCLKLGQEKLFLLTNGMILRLFIISTDHIGYVGLNVTSYLTVINILKTVDDIYICHHFAWKCRVCLLENEGRWSPIQTYGKIYTECKYDNLYHLLYSYHPSNLPYMYRGHLCAGMFYSLANKTVNSFYRSTQLRNLEKNEMKINTCVLRSKDPIRCTMLLNTLTFMK